MGFTHDLRRAGAACSAGRRATVRSVGATEAPSYAAGVATASGCEASIVTASWESRIQMQ